MLGGSQEIRVQPFASGPKLAQSLAINAYVAVSEKLVSHNQWLNIAQVQQDFSPVKAHAGKQKSFTEQRQYSALGFDLDHVRLAS